MVRLYCSRTYVTECERHHNLFCPDNAFVIEFLKRHAGSVTYTFIYNPVNRFATVLM
jgi:hypothetical protein